MILRAQDNSRLFEEILMSSEPGRTGRTDVPEPISGIEKLATG